MKEKIKYIITIISIFYMIIISILTIITLNNVNNEIDVTMNNFSSDFTNLRNKLDNIKNKECRDSIEKMIDKSEKYVIKDKLDIKDLYKNGSLLPEYGKVLKKCNIKDTNTKKLSFYILNSMMTQEDYIQNAIYQYELSLKDKETRLIGEISINNLKLNANKNLEIELINKIIEVQNEE